MFTLGIVLAAMGVPVANQQPAQGEFVLLRHGDTVRVERFTEHARVLRTEVTEHTGERQEISAWLGTNGVVDSMLVVEINGSSRYTYRTTFGERSIRSRSELNGDVEQVGPRATPGRVRATCAGSFALLQLITRSLRLSPGDSTTVSIGSDPESVRASRLLRLGDTVLVADEADLSWLALDGAGSIVGGRTRDGDRLTRRQPSRPTAQRELPGATGWAVVIHPWLAAARPLELDSLPGPVPVSYSKGNREYAEALRNRLGEVTRFYQDSLGARAAVSLLVLNKSHWSEIIGPQFWGFATNSGITGSSERVVMQPASGDGPLAELIGLARSRVPVDHWRQLDTTGLTPEALAGRHMDMVIAHEYGHVLVQSGSIPIIYGQPWLQEFLATYLMYAFLGSEHPELATLYDAWDRIVLEAARDPITEVTRYENLSSVSTAQLLWFYAATGNRARTCYRTRGLDLIRDLTKSLDPHAFPWMMPDARLLPVMEAACPGFMRWAKDMRSDPSP